MFYSKNLKKNKDIQHCFFSRKNGVSEGIYESLNCGLGSNDKKENVEKNLDIVSKKFNIERNSLVLMRQTHSNQVKIIDDKNNLERINCDAMLTKSNSIVLSVLTADCIPILIYENKNKNTIKKKCPFSDCLHRYQLCRCILRNLHFLYKIT